MLSPRADELEYFVAFTHPPSTHPAPTRAHLVHLSVKQGEVNARGNGRRRSQD
jgi:hypothetical protein